MASSDIRLKSWSAGRRTRQYVFVPPLGEGPTGGFSHPGLRLRRTGHFAGERPRPQAAWLVFEAEEKRRMASQPAPLPPRA